MIKLFGSAHECVYVCERARERQEKSMKQKNVRHKLIGNYIIRANVVAGRWCGSTEIKREVEVDVDVPMLYGAMVCACIFFQVRKNGCASILRLCRIARYVSWSQKLDRLSLMTRREKNMVMQNPVHRRARGALRRLSTTTCLSSSSFSSPVAVFHFHHSRLRTCGRA